MKTARNVLLRLMIMNALFASKATAAGVAVFKDQPYMEDRSAEPVVYARVLESAPTVVRLDVGGREAIYDGTRYAGRIDVSQLPENVRSDKDIAACEKVLADLKAFVSRFPKAAPVLKVYIDGYSSALTRLQRGEVRMGGKWISAAEYAAMVEQQMKAEAQRKEEERIDAEKQRVRRAAEAAYAKEQRSKGLEQYKGEWLPLVEVQARKKRDEQTNAVSDTIQGRSILKAEYVVNQILPHGALIRPVRGTMKTKGLALEVAYLRDINPKTAAEGDQYAGNLYWSGTYTYETVEGTKSTINAFSLELDSAEQIVRQLLYPSPTTSANASQDKHEERGKAAPRPEMKVLEGASASGSGFFVGQEGFFVTNAHVVEGAKQIEVFYNGKAFPAEIVKMVKVSDLALLKVPLNVSGFEIEEMDASPGNEVFAIGYPQPMIQGLEAKITKGIISSSKGLNDDDTRYQIDAAIQPGNSGGPLCNTHGKLVGVAVSTLNQLAIAARTGSIPQNVNYAIKASEVLALLRSKSINQGTGPLASTEPPITQAARKSALVIIR